MICTICLLLLLVAEAVFFTEIYTQGKKVELIIQNLPLSQYSNDNKCGLACQYLMHYQLALWLLVITFVCLAVVKIGSSFTQAGTDSCLTGNLMVSSFDLKNIAKTQLEELLQWRQRKGTLLVL